MSEQGITSTNGTTTFTFDIDAGQPVRLSVSNNDGEIAVRAFEGSGITVIATLKHGRQGEASDPQDDFVVDHKGNQISLRPNWHVGKTASDIAQKVKTQLKEGFRAEDWDFKKMRFAGDASYDLEVRVPARLPEGSTLAFRTTSGDVQVDGVTAAVSVATASADAQIANVEGKVTAHSASGDLTLRAITGSVESNTASGDISLETGDAWVALRSASGNIRVKDFTLKNARLTTVSGSVTLDAAVTNAADYTVDSVSGDVRLETRLPDGGATLTYRSMSGDPSVGGDWTKGSGKRTWTVRGAEGGPRISVKTVSGDLHANATVDGSLEARSEAMPTGMHEEDADTGVEAEQMSASAREESGGHEVTIDADWEKAKGWLKDITHRVSKFVEDLDAAGDRQYKARTGEGEAKTEPIVVEPLDTGKPLGDTFAATEPLTPETPLPPQAPEPPAAPTEPIPPMEPEEPAGETTAQRRLRLLEAVQRGELTVDEALAQLDGPDETA